MSLPVRTPSTLPESSSVEQKPDLKIIDKPEEERLRQLYGISAFTLVGLKYLMDTRPGDLIQPMPGEEKKDPCALDERERQLMIQVGLAEGRGERVYPAVTRQALSKVIQELQDEGSPFFPKPSEDKFYVGGI
jgi:hypothetical protein